MGGGGVLHGNNRCGLGVGDNSTPTSLRGSTVKNPLVLAAVIALVLLSAAGPSAEDVARSGTFTRQDYKIAGSWSIIEQDGKWHVRLSDDFKTKSAPDLKIFLSPADLDTLTGKTATRNSVLVAPLRSSKGGQSYELPDGVDVTRYRSIVIHCEQYSKLWGGGSL